MHAPAGSYPGRVAAAELHEAERALEVLDELLGRPVERVEPPIDIYLADAVVGGAPRVAVPDATDALVRVVQPEAPGVPIAYPLTELVIRRRFGDGAASARCSSAGSQAPSRGKSGRGPPWTKPTRPCGASSPAPARSPS